MTFSSERVSKDWGSDELDPALRALVIESQVYLYRSFSLNVNLTCLLRTPEEDKELYHDPNHEPGVHTVGRGADISVRNLSFGEVQRLVNTINDRWQYDPNRPAMLCALVEGEGPDSTGPHIHLQVHPNTKLVAGAA